MNEFMDEGSYEDDIDSVSVPLNFAMGGPVDAMRLTPYTATNQEDGNYQDSHSMPQMYAQGGEVEFGDYSRQRPPLGNARQMLQRFAEGGLAQRSVGSPFDLNPFTGNAPVGGTPTTGPAQPPVATNPPSIMPTMTGGIGTPSTWAAPVSTTRPPTLISPDMTQLSVSQQYARDLATQDAASARTRGEITGLYKDVLGRDPDRAGMDYWMRTIGADNVITPDEIAQWKAMAAKEKPGINTAVVGAGTDTTAGKETSVVSGGTNVVNTNVGGANTGNTNVGGAVQQAPVFEYLNNTPEQNAKIRGMLTGDNDYARGQLMELYTETFNRVPDTAGFNYWLNTIGKDNILTKDEIAQWNANAQKELAQMDQLKGLYGKYLQREPDEAGRAYWMGQIAAAGGVNSGIESLFQQGANREVTMGNAGYRPGLYNQMGSRETPEAVAQLEAQAPFRFGPNDYARSQLLELYTDVLGRPVPDEEGFNWWLQNYGSDNRISKEEENLFIEAAQRELNARKMAKGGPVKKADGGEDLTPVVRQSGSPEYGEIAIGGGVTPDTKTALTTKQGFSGKEAMDFVKRVYGEGASNLESLVRGSVAAIPGSFGDIESIFRDDKNRKLATTEEILRDRMPKRVTAPTKEAAGFEEVGTYLPLPIPAGTVTQAAKTAGKGVETGAAKMLEKLGPRQGRGWEQLLADTGSRSYVMKPKGGNWVKGENSPESVVQRTLIGMEELNKTELERTRERIKDARASVLAVQGLERQRRTPAPSDSEFLSRQTRRLAGLEAREKELSAQAAVNNWLNTKLVRYIKTDMATPGDPVRALAETGVSHSPEIMRSREVPVSFEGPTASRAKKNRALGGFPEEGMGQSVPAQRWEMRTDQAIDVTTAGKIRDQAERGAFMNSREKAARLIQENPWITKVDPEEKVYMVNDYVADPFAVLNFSHLKDELASAVSPTSNLPENLRLAPEALEKLTVPQAVQRVADIDNWRAEEALRVEKAGMLENLKGESRFAEPNMKLSFVEEPGGTWINLPDTTDEAGKRLCTSIGGAAGWCTQQETNALKYGSGDNRLSVLLDTEGRPHIQVSIKDHNEKNALDHYAGRFSQTWSSMDYVPTLKQKEAYQNAIDAWRSRNPDSGSMGQEEVVQALEEAGVKPPPNIVEIKPPQNTFASQQSQTYIGRDPTYEKQSQQWALNFLNSQEWGKVEKLDDLKLFKIVDTYDPESVKYAVKSIYPDKEVTSSGGTRLTTDPRVQEAYTALSDMLDGDVNAPRFMSENDFFKIIRDVPQKFSKGGVVKKDATTPDMFSKAAKLFKDFTSSAPADTTLKMDPYESMYTVKEVGSPEKGRKAALNVYSSLLPALMRTRFPDYVANSPATVLKDAPRGAENVGEFDVFYRTIALDPEGTNSMLMEPYGKYGYVGMGSNVTTDETLNALNTMLHESMHARTRGAKGKTLSVAHPAEQLKKLMAKDRFDEMIRDIRISDVPSVYSAPSSAEVINEYFATATPVKQMADKDMVTKRSRRYLAEVDRLAKKYPELEKMRVTWERPELFFKD